MNKLIIGLIAICLMFLPVLAGCDKKEKESPKVTVVIKDYYEEKEIIEGKLSSTQYLVVYYPEYEDTLYLVKVDVNPLLLHFNYPKKASYLVKIDKLLPYKIIDTQPESWYNGNR